MQLGRLLLVLLIFNGLFGLESSAAGAEDRVAEAYRGKKILWIDSYHAGYEWSDGIERGIRNALEGTGVDLIVWRLNSKRNTSEAYCREAGHRAKKVIDEYQPDVVIASDDNAQKYLVVPYLKDTDFPVVFCGLNCQPANYGYPCCRITGMCETDYIDALARQMRNFAGGDRIGMLAGYTESEKSVAHRYQHIFGGRLKVYWVRTLSEYQREFLRAQQEVDILYLGNNAGIADWDDAAAEVFMMENIRIPTGAVLPWMKKQVVFTLAKLPEEQGEYAAATALRILAGSRPEDIPLCHNKLAHLSVNLKMAKAVGLILPVSLLKTAEVIGQEAFQQSIAQGQ